MMAETSARVRRGAMHVVRFGRAHLPAVHFLLDGALWAVAIPIGVWFRYDFDTSHITVELLRSVALALVLVNITEAPFTELVNPTVGMVATVM